MSTLEEARLAHHIGEHEARLRGDIETWRRRWLAAVIRTEDLCGRVADGTPNRQHLIAELREEDITRSDCMIGLRESRRRLKDFWVLWGERERP